MKSTSTRQRVDPSARSQPELRDLTPDAGQALHASQAVLSPDGSTLLVNWMVPLEGGRVRSDLVAIEVETGSRRTLAAAEDGSFDYERPAISADGRRAAVIRTSRATVGEPPAVELWLIDLADGAGRVVNAGDEPYPHEVAFNADGSALVVTADWHGHAPLFQIDIETEAVTRITGEGSWSSSRCAPDGVSVYALRSTTDEPPRPVRLALPVSAPVERDDLTVIDAPGAIEQVPGRLRGSDHRGG